MRRGRTAAIIFGGTTILISAGSGISAWADWTADAPSAEARGITGHVPQVGKPTATKPDGRPKVDWTAPNSAPDRLINGYVIVRVQRGGSHVVCTVPATTRTCVDETPPAGASTYVVRATAGGTWVGPDSPASDPVKMDVAASTLAKVSVPTSASAGAPSPDNPKHAPTTEAAPTTEPAVESVTTPPAPLPEKTEDKPAPPPASTTAEPEPTTAAPEPSASGSAGEGIPK